MEPNPADQVAAVDPSGQLALNPINTGGPINRMPNEIMLRIFDKLKLKRIGDNDEDGYRYYYDANELVKFRLVSTRWNLLVEDFCRQKKSLNVNCISFSNPHSKSSVPLIANLKTLDFFGTIFKLFPNVVQLAVGFWSKLDDTQIRDFAAQIDALTSLKLLKLAGEILLALPHLSLTLSKLEHFEVDFGSRFYTKDDLLQYVSCLGPVCTVRLYLNNNIKLNRDHFLQWHNSNHHFFANLTHLKMYFYGHGDCSQVVHFLSEHAPSLQFLALYTVNFYLEMSPTVIRDLGKLTKLTKLKLWRIAIDIAELEAAAVQDELTSLSSVLICELYIEWGFAIPNYGDKFTRVLSAIFPNLVDLDLDIGRYFSRSQSFLRKIEQDINRFPNMRNYQVAFL